MAEEKTMTEAGFSMNVKMFDRHGQEVMLTFRAPLANQATVLIGHYESVVTQLVETGWQVSKTGARPAGNGAATAADASTPVCRVHNAPMRLSNKGTGFYCSKKVGDGYCKEKAV